MSTTSVEGVEKGAYIVRGSPDETPDVILMGTGTPLLFPCQMLRTMVCLASSNPLGAQSSTRAGLEMAGG